MYDLKDLIDELDALINIRGMLEEDIEAETDMITIAYYCVEWAIIQEEIIVITKLIYD